MLADSSLLYKHSAIMANSVSENKRLSLGLVLWYLWVAIWNCERGFFAAWFWLCSFVICSLLVCCNFWIWFVALSLVFAQFVFGIRYSYLVFVNLWFFGLYLWERVIWVYLGFGFVRGPQHQFVLSQICYSEICSSLSVDVIIAESRNFWCFVSNFHLD